MIKLHVLGQSLFSLLYAMLKNRTVKVEERPCAYALLPFCSFPLSASDKTSLTCDRISVIVFLGSFEPKIAVPATSTLDPDQYQPL